MSSVWNATDGDREGQLIDQVILEHCRYRGEVLRVMFTAQDPQTIRSAFRRARLDVEYARLYEAAVAHRQADKLYNLSLTRTATVTLGRDVRSVIDIGRVKTPTMAIACRRELEIHDFVPVVYLGMVATVRARVGAFRMRHGLNRLLGVKAVRAVVGWRCVPVPILTRWTTPLRGSIMSTSPFDRRDRRNVLVACE